MKRMIPMLLAALLLLTSCSAKPQIAPASLTAQETAILKLAGVEPRHFFDVITPEGARSMSVRAWKLEDGAWAPHGGSINQLDGKSRQARIGVIFDLIGECVRFAVKIEGGDQGAIEVSTDGKLDTTGKMIGTMTLMEKQDAVLNEEIPLMVQIITDGGSIQAGSVSTFDFSNPAKYAGMGDVYVITAYISDLPTGMLE